MTAAGVGPRVGVSIVGFHTALELLVRAVTALAGQTEPPSVVLVHLNEDGEQGARFVEQALREVAGDLVLEVGWSAENLGFCLAHNRLVARALASGCTAVVVHNPDLALDSDALAHLVRAVGEHGTRALYGPLLELIDPVSHAPEGLIDTAGIRWTRDGRHLDDLQGEPLPLAPRTGTKVVAGISGACLLVTADAHEVLVAGSGELFDEAFFAYREDAELAYRAALLDVPSVLVHAARGGHVRGLRGVRRGDPVLDRLGVQNRFLTAAKYGRARPGGPVQPFLRDLVVIAAVLLVERSSLPGLREAWRLRRVQRDKGRRVAASAVAARAAPRAARR